MTRRIDLVRSMQTEVAVVQSESSDSPWTSGSAANQRGGARSQRGQPRQIKCWTCIHPRKSSPSTSAGASLSTCATTPAPISQRSRGAFSRRGDLLRAAHKPQEKRLFLLGFNTRTQAKTSKQIKKKASVWHKNRESWQRWREVCREWWDRARTRTTQGEATLWKVIHANNPL